MKLKNTFVQGKMNKDLDERLLPKGQYPHAENIRVANTEGADMGAIENVKGNEKLTNFNLTNPKTIGAFSDGSNQKVYWFTTSDEKDLVVEYDVLNAQTNVLLESSNPNGVLNFKKTNLITGVSKIINGDPNRDLLVWTDDVNPPRIINIERAKTYGADNFIEDDISLIKKPPRFAPKTNLTFTSSSLENNIEGRFLSFAYRYRYLDGEYSALSSFTNYNFAPSSFELDYQTMENEGMVNSFNAVRIGFNTGSKRVTDIQLVFKESNSNSLSIIETFNKENEGWADDSDETFLFSNSKRYTFLPDDELFRAYDNVPKVAKAMEIIGNRVVFGNYTEGYDLVNRFGQDVNVDYNLSLLSRDLGGENLTVTITADAIANDTFIFDVGDNELKEGTRLTLDIFLEEVTYSNGSFSNTFDFILNRDYVDAIELSEDEDFILFVQTIMTNIFLADYSATPPDDSELINSTPFGISASTATTISITSPKLTYKIDNTPADLTDEDFREEVSNWTYTTQSKAFYKLVAIDSSLKTNRSYEVGIIYLDEHNRATTVLTDADNTIYVPQELSINQNRIVVSLNHNPPVWADRYKLVVKQNKTNYQTIYTNVFYEDGLFRWVKLEGANVNKVSEGDTLIVKSDLGGVVAEPIKVRVLEVTTKEEDFLEDNENVNGEPIVEEAGLYMKIKPVGFDMNFNNSTTRTFVGSSHLRYPVNTFTAPEFGEVSNGVFTPFTLNAGSTVKMFIEFEARGAIEYKETYDKTFKVAQDYNSVEDWFNAEVEDLGSFGEDYTRGFGFNDDGSKFFVRAHRDGTASRNITTRIQIDILFSDGIVIFETEPEDSDVDIYYETEQTFEIKDGYHLGNTQNQSSSNTSAIVEMDFFNCYVQGNGAESYRVKDTFNERFLNIDFRPTTTSIERYKEVRRYADLTYSAPYNENANLNGLNEFNLSLANYKEDIDKRYGFIQKLFARDTDLVVFQEDKVSKVLYGKDLLMNADGTSNVSSIEDVLGQQVAYMGEYGISRNPESFTFDGFNIYFTDAKRGAVMRLGGDGLNEISAYGLRTWFRDKFKDSIDNKKLGGFDPHNDQYIVHPTRERLSLPVFIDCGGQVSRFDFEGELEITIDFGIKVGQAGFTYTSNGVPVKYDLEWNGQTFSTGFVGDASYNPELAALGLPNVTGSGSGSFNFNKTESVPTEIKVTITAPICGAEFTLGTVCITSPQLKVVSVVLNDGADNTLTMNSRYRWNTPSYNSPLKTYNSVFEEGELDTYDTQQGEEGSGFIPIAGSGIRMESFNGFNQTAKFLEENKMGYLVSNTLYTEAEILDLVDDATFPVATETIYSNQDILNTVDFTFDRPNNEEYLYLIWDYRNPELVIDQDTKIRIYFDSSGSMNSTLAPLQIMRDTILKDRLLPLYNGDSALYDASVEVISEGSERTMDMLNLQGETPEGNVISLVFQDESNPVYYGSTFDTKTSQYDTDIAALRNRLAIFPTDYYRGVIFQVNEDSGTTFKQFVTAVRLGTSVYSGVNGLSDRNEFNYKFDVNDGDTPQYYLDQIVDALTELGYVL